MDDGDKKKFSKIIKQKMIEILESGTIKEPLAQINFIENELLLIACFDEKKINKAILKYFEDQDNLKKQIDVKQWESSNPSIIDEQKEKLANDLQKIMDEYSKNSKEIYELVKQYD